MKRSFAVLAACALAFMLVSACTQGALPSPSPTPVPNPAPETPPAATPSPSPEPAMPAFAGELDEDFWKRVDGSTATIPLTAALREYFGGGEPPFHTTTPVAYSDLINGPKDIIFVTAPSEDEWDVAREHGVELEVIPIVKDALVFLANAENPVSTVSLVQLRDIYTGNITDWETLGGLDEIIIPYQRTPNSGSQTLFIQLVMDGQTPMRPPSEWLVADMSGLVERVSYYNNARDALGYSMFYYVNNMYGNSQFKLLAVDGVRPSRDTIARGEYPLEDYYYAVIRKDTPADSPARKLIDWLLTAGGQALAVRAGYIPLQPLENVFPDETIDPIYLGDVNHSSGTGGTAPKPGIADVEVNGVRKPLSDLFYDGFNYIAYINGEIINWMTDQHHGDYFTPHSEEVTRPFAGIPNDYPHYWLREKGDFGIDFPEGNPFFRYALSIRIPLTEDISPYGTAPDGFSVAYHHDRPLLPNVDLFTIRVEMPGAPETAERVNEQLKAWTDGFSGGRETLLNQFIQWVYGEFYGDSEDFNYRLWPSYGRWKNYLSVSYILYIYEDFTPPSMPMLHTACFDMDTGEAVNLADALPRDLAYGEAAIFTPITGYDESGPLDSGRLEEGYAPAAGSAVTAAWIMNGTLCLYVTEPDGRVLQAYLHTWADQ